MNYEQTSLLAISCLTDRPSLSWLNDRVEGPCQPGEWTRDLPNLQFTPPGQGGRGKGRKDDVDDRRNEAVTQMSAKTK